MHVEFGLLIFTTGFCSCSNIDDVDKTMNEINEQTENMKQIQEALSAPIGAATDFDEVRDSFLFSSPSEAAQKVQNDNDGLAELQREMAL
ncbi:UNVERIFIED_CONTAM: Vacuolar protein sorting-associated protein [Sesamum latifolium]|uniref:Vacuolar protein sorting-associated protein n=1 Tax=Sesamum latifolium TaxID=2727402 RepID=A0AAW2TMM9_9LAMI